MARNASADKAVGFGWVGRWSDGTIGWILPDHLLCYPKGTEAPDHRPYVDPDKRLVRCRITVEVLKDRCGRPITRRACTVGASGQKGG